MEIQKQTPDLTFKWHDVTFTVRARATVEDRFEINVLYDVDKHNTVRVPRGKVYRTLIERFVTGWSGVTQEGKAIPFSMEHLAQLPVDGDDDVMLLLGSFIFNHCGMWPKESETDKKKA